MTIPEHTRFSQIDLQRFAEQTREEFRRLQNAPFLDGAPLELAAHAAAGAFTVPHSLRRVPRGFFVTYVRMPTGATAAWSLYHRTGGVWSQSVIELYATGAFDLARIWVF